MRTLTLAFYGEGTTDYRFLPAIIQRTAEKLLSQAGAPDVEVLPPIPIDESDAEDGAHKILAAAKGSAGMDMLIVHLDADTRTVQVARVERFSPGHDLVQIEQLEVCRDLVPLIPVKNIEAWLLSDPDAFRDKVGSDLTDQELGLPSHPHQVEGIPDPKQTYRDAVRTALAKRGKRRAVSPGEYYEPLSQAINLERLERVPAYQTFRDELERALRHRRFLL